MRITEAAIVEIIPASVSNARPIDSPRDRVTSFAESLAPSCIVGNMAGVIFSISSAYLRSWLARSQWDWHLPATGTFLLKLSNISNLTLVRFLSIFDRSLSRLLPCDLSLEEQKVSPLYTYLSRMVSKILEAFYSVSFPYCTVQTVQLEINRIIITWRGSVPDHQVSAWGWFELSCRHEELGNGKAHHWQGLSRFQYLQCFQSWMTYVRYFLRWENMSFPFLELPCHIVNSRAFILCLSQRKWCTRKISYVCHSTLKVL